MKIFCLRLKQLRGKESQASFAKKLGMSQVSYGRYELGTREPDLKTLCQIGLITGQSIDWLLGLDSSDDNKNIRAENAERKLDGLKKAITALLKEY